MYYEEKGDRKCLAPKVPRQCPLVLVVKITCMEGNELGTEESRLN
jgi:hypothetical protein